MKKWVLLALLAVFLSAVLIRLYPLTQYEIWGSDSGEYYSITDRLVSDGYVSTDYDGWGFAYPNFPGMYYISGGASQVTGLDVLPSLIVLIPIIASLSVLVMFFLVKILFRSDGAGLLAGAFTAVAMPHVFTTSHPMPGSLGDVLLVFCLLLLIASYKNKKFTIPLVLTSMALTITHHLSAYFLFIMVLGGVFYQEMHIREDKGDTRFLWLFLVFFLTLQILFWSLAARPFTDRVISPAFDVPLWALFSGGYIAILLAFAMVRLRRRMARRYEPMFPGWKAQLLKYFLLLAVLISIMIFVAYFTVLGTTVTLNPEIIVLFTPFIILVAGGAIGPGYARLFRHGLAVTGWLFALLVSAFFGIATSSHVLLPYRHTQYLALSVAVLLGIGFVAVFNSVDFNRKFSMRMLAVSVVVLLLGLTALSAYPPKTALGGFQEGTSSEDMQALFWARESLPVHSTVASDHRMSSMLFGFGGLNATWDSAGKTLHAASYSECQDQIAGLNTPSGEKPIDYILLDDEIKDGVALLQWENAEPMSPEAMAKFDEGPFIKLYEANGVEIYGLAAE